jgi:hypothetical protein
MSVMRVLLGLMLMLTAAACSGEALEAADEPTAVPTGSPTATPTPADAAPEPTDRPSVEMINASWQDSDSLARTHLLNGTDMICETCHGDLTEPVSKPEDATCLNCHGESYAQLAAETNTETRTVHPLDHLSDTACTFCHTGHEPYRDPCSICH